MKDAGNYISLYIARAQTVPDKLQRDGLNNARLTQNHSASVDR